MTALLVLLAAAPVQGGEGPGQLWRDAGQIAEVAPSEEGAAAVRALDADAFVTSASPRVSLWRLSGLNAAEVLTALEGKLPGRFAPVFRDGPGPGSKLRVPAGGVLVWLHSAADAARFVGQHRLVVKQDFGNGTLLVGSAPGAASLALTAALLEDRRVKAVIPNWWLRAVRK